MKTTSKKQKIEYGDWQTPIELANRVCQKLVDLGVNPDIIIEPTCGIGNFLRACNHYFHDYNQILGFEYNPDYVHSAQNNFQNDFSQISISQNDFFTYEWDSLFKNITGELLVIGNFPWVTNSQQGTLNGNNLPIKANLNGVAGISAITGHSNFDISEWMLRQTHQWFLNKKGTIAMLCKLSVARKFLSYLYDNQHKLKEARLFKIDSQKYFQASVEACLLYCHFDNESRNYDYKIFDNLDIDEYQWVGYRAGGLVSNITSFETYQYLKGENHLLWRSGIKHDCASILELRKTEDGYQNGLGEIIDLEPEWIYPLLKGSDIANGRSDNTGRFVLVTQQHHQDSTFYLQQYAPKIWAYLERHANYFEIRKSRIYRQKDRFAMFGIGEYSFKPYKIAIASLYKSLRFELLYPYENTPVMVDDTVYFLGFNDELEAKRILEFLQSKPATYFLESLIFWDDKRPIKTSILNQLKLLPLKPIQLPLL